MNQLLQNRFVRIFIVALAYFVTGKLGTMFAIPPGVATAVWPPSGMAVAALFFWGNRIWPGVFLGSVLVNIGTLYEPSTLSDVARSFVIASSIAAGSTLQAMAGAYLIRQFVGSIFEKIADVLRFVLIGFSCCLIAATIGTTSLLVGGYISSAVYGMNWLTWWLGDAAGVLLFTPLVLTWKQEIKGKFSIRWKKSWEFSLFLALLFGTSSLIHMGSGVFTVPIPLYFPYIPFVAWAALRFRQFTMVFVTMIISLLAILTTIQMAGSLMIEFLNPALLILQAFIGVSVVTGLLLSSSLYESRQGQIHLKKAHEDLQEKVEEIRLSNLQMEQFTHMVSHDLQEPLHTIIGFVERFKLKLEDSLESKGRDYIDRIGTAAWRMSQLIDGLLTYSRVTRKPAVFEVISLKKVIQELVADLQVRLLETGARVEIGEIPDVYGDRLQLHQLFQNLISNALKFRKQDTSPRVKISSGPLDSESIAIHVEDNGIGIDKKFSNLIFKPFERLNPRQEFEGSGLGLAICQKIVEHHKGQIQFRSELGKGTVFTVILPTVPTRLKRANA